MYCTVDNHAKHPADIHADPRLQHHVDYHAKDPADIQSKHAADRHANHYAKRPANNHADPMQSILQIIIYSKTSCN